MLEGLKLKLLTFHVQAYLHASLLQIQRHGDGQRKGIYYMAQAK
jgi:hypothetical protein